MDELDEIDSGWAHAENTERRRREDEALERHRVLLNESRTELAKFEREYETFVTRTHPRNNTLGANRWTLTH